MTIFIATLFLPYTVNFDSPPPSQEDENLFAAKIAAPLTESPGPIIQDPGATVDHERIFRPHTLRPITLTFPGTPQRSEPAGPAETEARPLSPVSPMSRHDVHSPGWGTASSSGWHQPPSKAASLPPSSILEHAAREPTDKDKAAVAAAATGAVTPGTPSRWRRHPRSRTASHDRAFADRGYTVEKTVMGNGGLFNAIDAAVAAGLLADKTWVGTLGCPVDVLDDHVRESIAEKLEDDHDALAVYVSDSDLNGHYEHYCKTILWPVVNYQIPDHPKSKAYEDHSWIFYVKVNEAFADRIARNYKKGDVIWIHDYHLLLVPRLLRQRLPDAPIGFFLHTAFPSSEIFRCLATRLDLLEGVLGANLVGLQNDEYCHHFRQTCSRLLNVEATRDGVILEDGRFVHVGPFPTGIDAALLDRQRQTAEVRQWVRTIADKYRGKRIIVARDKLDSIRGVRQKILAYELFLHKYPAYKDDVVLIQIATTAAEDPELTATVADMVTRVNSAHSTLAHQPLVFLKQDIDYAQYLALLTVAECLMIASLRDGMNLTSHEFVVCQDGRHHAAATKHGPLILSEFTGSASVFGRHAVLVNPWHYAACADAIKAALDMAPFERERRWAALADVVDTQNACGWFTAYVGALEHAWKEHAVRATASVPRLALPAVRAKYARAAGRLLILDYEGTLASWGAPTDIILTTPKRSIDVLNDLIDDPHNTVYVMSARMPEEMERLFRPVSGVGLIAENGAFVLEPGADAWRELVDLGHVHEWKKGVRSMLQYYVDRVAGSKIDERHASLIFDYADADDVPGAFKQAGECANHINDACRSQRVRAVPIDDGLFVSDVDVDKGRAAGLIAEALVSKADAAWPEFLLVVGDSREDEYVFHWAHELEKAGQVHDVVTVTLGDRSTEASATLTQGVTGVLSLLEKLAAVGARRHGSVEPDEVQE